MVLGDAPMQRRVGQDGVVGGLAGVAEPLAEDQPRVRHVLSRGGQRHGVVVQEGERNARARGAHRGSNHPRPAAEVEHVGARGQCRQRAQQQGGALIDAIGGKDAGIRHPVSGDAADGERHGPAPGRQRAAQPRGVGRPPGRHHAAMAARRHRLDAAAELLQHGGGGADAFVVAAVEDQAAIGRQHAEAGVRCHLLLVLGLRQPQHRKIERAGGRPGLGPSLAGEPAIPHRCGDAALAPAAPAARPTGWRAEYGRATRSRRGCAG